MPSIMHSSEEAKELLLRVAELDQVADQQEPDAATTENSREVQERTAKQADEQRKDHETQINLLNRLRSADQSLIRRLEEMVRDLREANSDLQARDDALDERLETLQFRDTNTRTTDASVCEPPKSHGNTVDKLYIEMEEELEAKEKEIKCLQKDLKTSHKRIDELEQALYEYRTSRKEIQEDLQQSIKHKDRDNSRLKAEISQLQSKFANTVNSLNNRLKEKDNELTKLGAAYEHKIDQYKALEADIEVLKDGLERGRKGCQKKVDSLKEEIKALGEVYKEELWKAYALVSRTGTTSQANANGDQETMSNSV